MDACRHLGSHATEPAGISAGQIFRIKPLKHGLDHVESPQNALNGRLEEPGVSWIQAPKSVVVHHHAAKTAVLSQRARLWPDGLSRKHTADRGELRVPVHQLDVASQLLHGV